MPSLRSAPRRAILPVLVASAISLTACSGGGSSSSSSSSGGKTLVVDTSFNLKTADPGRMYEQTGLMVDRALY
ncbi:ABC transporter substrate-binding protein, partial [Actinoallomurus sp. NPDC052308]